MTVIEFTGLVDREDDVDGPLIGGRNVIDECYDAFGLFFQSNPNVTVMLAVGGHEWLYQGQVDIVLGEEGYSEYTPGLSPQLTIGKQDLLDTVNGYYGQMVHLRIDAPKA